VIPAWIWPQRQKSDPNIGVRLARVLHWLAIVAGSLCLAFGLLVTSATAYSALRYQKPASPSPQYTLIRSSPSETAKDPYANISTPVSAEAVYAPPPPMTQYGGLIIGLIAFIGFCAVGRGLRYVLADE
jgi:hypothetical protein